MTHFLYFLLAQAAAVCSWVSRPVPKKRRQAEARKAMSKDLFGPPEFKLVRGGKK